MRNKCPRCGLNFDKRKDLRSHIKEAHPKDLFQCQHCDKTFLSAAGRKAHIKREHRRFFERSAFGNLFVDIDIVDVKHNEDVLLFLAANQSKIEEALLKRGKCKYSLILQVSMLKIDGEGNAVRASPYFRSQIVVQLNGVEEDQLDEVFKKVHQSFTNYCREGSGWTLHNVIRLIVRTADYEPVPSGSSYIPLPPLLEGHKNIMETNV